jgi:hypothetical protein
MHSSGKTKLKDIVSNCAD